MRDYNALILLGMAILCTSCAFLRSELGAETPQDLRRRFELAERYGPTEDHKPPRSVREAYVAQHPELKIATKNAILGGRADVVMTREQVKVAWGEPTSIKPMQGKADEIWRYNGDGGLFTLLYFRNGVIVRQDIVNRWGIVLETEFSGLY